MKQTCSICGEEDDEYFMFRIQTSRVQWMCAQCHEKAVREVDQSEVMKKRKKKKKAAEQKQLREDIK